MQALACPDCGDPTEDPGLCVACWDSKEQGAYGAGSRARGRKTNRKVWAALDSGRTATQAAEDIGCSLRTVYHHMKRGRQVR